MGISRDDPLDLGSLSPPTQSEDMGVFEVRSFPDVSRDVHTASSLTLLAAQLVPGEGAEMHDEVYVSRLIDHADVVAVVVRYATAMDTKDWRLLETCFTETAHIDYNTGVEYDRAQFVAHAQDALTPMLATQHSISNHDVDLDGDTARATAYVHAHHVKARGQDFIVAGVYRDSLTRTEQGWKIQDREFTPTWRVGQLRDAEKRSIEG